MQAVCGLFHQSTGFKEPNQMTAMRAVPTESENPLEALTWYYKMVCMCTGGIEMYDTLFEITDWADVYERYILVKGAAYG